MARLMGIGSTCAWADQVQKLCSIVRGRISASDNSLIITSLKEFFTHENAGMGIVSQFLGGNSVPCKGPLVRGSPTSQLRD